MLGFRDYLNYAERHLMFAEDAEKKVSDASWALIPAVILAWSAIEFFVNNMLDDFSSLPEDMFELHERAFLLEKRIKFVDTGDRIGQFILEGAEYRRLEDKIFFLMAKVATRNAQNLKGDALWQNFQEFKDTRDALVHPRRDKEILIDKEKVNKFIETSKEIIQLLSMYVWNKTVYF